MNLFKPAVALTVIMLLALIAACASTGDKKPKEPVTIPNYIASGKIVNLKDKIIEVERFLHLEPTLTFFYEGYRHSMPIIAVKSVENIGNGYLNLTTVKGRSFKVVGTMGIISQKSVIYFQTKSIVDIMPMAGDQEKAPEKKVQYLTSRIDGEATKHIEFVWKKLPYKQSSEKSQEMY